jgi:hypothetical protein
MYKPYICKMYISVHNLNIETGRFYDLDGHGNLHGYHTEISRYYKKHIQKEYLLLYMSSLIYH